MTLTRRPGPARPGDVLGGRYRLDELIGEGGMGSVWRATDHVLERTVAVKVFWAAGAEESDAARRESEKRLLAAVSHPSLVTLFDAHLSSDDLSYLVMEHVEGGTLSSLIVEGPVAPRDVASLATDVGDALHVVHRAGIIHRDVKPANILLRPALAPEYSFRAVLADFGIAHVADAARVTAPGTAMGTAAYISPEQVRGHAPSPASDVYSLGLVLIEALSGPRAFPAQTPIEAISVRLSSAPRVPGHWGYGWRSLLTAMTALDPDERPTALEVSRRARELDRADFPPAPTVAVPVTAAPPDEQTRPLAALPLLGAHVAAPASPPSTRREAQLVRARAARRRRSFVTGGALAAAAAVALTVWAGASASVPAPTQAPNVVEPARSVPAPALTLEPAPRSSATQPAVSDTDDAIAEPGGPSESEATSGDETSGGVMPGPAGTSSTANGGAAPEENGRSDKPVPAVGKGKGSGAGPKD